MLAATLLVRILIQEKSPEDQVSNSSSNYPERIVSLAPSITETLYALGLGDKVVAVTRYCIFPAEAKKKPQVGGYYDPNLESLVSLEPDLVVLLPEHEKIKETMDDLGIRTHLVQNRHIKNIIGNISDLGRICGAEAKANELVEDIQRRLDIIKNSASEGISRKVMLTVGRNMGSGALSDVYITGINNFYDEMVILAGGVNAYQGPVSFPAMSAEGILQIDPDVIIDLVPDLLNKGWDVQTIKDEWKNIPNLRAVRENNIYVLGGDHVVIPGPRFIIMAEEIANAINPDFKVEP